MIINNNIPALGTYRQLGANQLASSKSMEKLSSGLRINRAGDDAAGLAISEKMRAQIRGLDQASRNAQDGISLIQTAEGALQETHSIIQRMRELAVQAANDTNAPEDRIAIQDEINQLTAEVDRIGNNTEFNTKKLLNAGGLNSETVNNILNGIQNHGWLSVGEQMISDFFGIEAVEGHNLTVEFVNNSSASFSARVWNSTGTTDQKLEINLAYFDPSEGVHGDNLSGPGNYSDRVLAHEMVHAVMNSYYGAANTQNMPSWFKEGTAEFLHGADERLKVYIHDGNGGFDDTEVDKLVTRGVELLNGDWGANSYDYATSYVLTKFIDSELSVDRSFSDFMQDIKTNIGTGDNGTEALKKAIVSNTDHTSFDEFISEFESEGAAFVKSLTINFNGEESDTGSIAGSDHGGSSLNGEDVINNDSAQAGVTSLRFNVILPDSSSIVSSSVTLHIGANAGQSINIDLQDMRSGALGISEQDVSTNEGASAAIEAFDAAIEKVSSFRSNLGAYQNRLEHSISNLTNTSENLQAAESRIRDVDMAREVMEMTKNNILSQASQAMLAQANQAPQAVLQLLG